MVFRAAMEEGVVKREDCIYMTKVWNDMHERVEEACRKSIADLQCGYVDLYFIPLAISQTITRRDAAVIREIRLPGRFLWKSI